MIFIALSYFFLVPPRNHLIVENEDYYYTPEPMPEYESLHNTIMWVNKHRHYNDHVVPDSEDFEEIGAYDAYDEDGKILNDMVKDSAFVNVLQGEEKGFDLLKYAKDEKEFIKERNERNDMLVEEKGIEGELIYDRDEENDMNVNVNERDEENEMMVEEKGIEGELINERDVENDMNVDVKERDEENDMNVDVNERDEENDMMEEVKVDGRELINERDQGNEINVNVNERDVEKNKIDDEGAVDFNVDIQDDQKKKTKKVKSNMKEVLKGCGPKCRRKCTEHLTEERRESINRQYWELSHERRGDWLFRVVREVGVKRKTVEEESRKVKRTKTYEYFLPNNKREHIQVCQLFFLRTLGYTNNKKLVCLFRAPQEKIAAKNDERGRHEPSNKTGEDIIKAIDDHIMSANPTCSHYRRKHAPQRFYLPSELKATTLHRYFKETYPEWNVHYDIYRQRIKALNISFAKLGLEDCERCLAHTQHMERSITSKYTNHGVDYVMSKLVNAVECATENCEECADYKKHEMLYKVAREEYEKDKKSEVPEDTIIATTDMQKVIMLPRMPGIKLCIFTKRLTTFHMTFAPVGGMTQGKGRPIGIIWHDATRGRQDKDVTSTFVKYLKYMRNKKKVVLWVDNCSAQNKN